MKNLRRNRNFLNSVLFFISLATCIITSACTSSETVQTPPGFHFKPKEVTSLTIAKSDPITGDHWVAVFKRNSPEDKWIVASAPSDQTVADLQANTGFINHLLDTFPTLHIDEPAPKGSLESLGLDPPLFALRWQTPQGEHELRIGSQLKNKGSSYIQTGNSSPSIASGSALRLLELIESFKFLRERTWSTMTSDDVDEIEIKLPGKPLFYAQREGSVWTDRKHREIKKDIHKLLENMTTAQSVDFIDEPKGIEELKKYVLANSQFEAKLTDRHGNSTFLKMKLRNDTLYGISSGRPNVVMVLSPNLLKTVSF